MFLCSFSYNVYWAERVHQYALTQHLEPLVPFWD